jgi:molybdenum cofactor cytidylyltransferase
MPQICAIILAAGESRRMGTNKLILPYQGQPLIIRVIDNVRQAGIRDILIVTGAFRDEIVSLLEELPVRHCYNTNYKQGMLSSVQCGFQHLQGSEDAVILFLGDQPMLPPMVASLLTDTYEQSGKGIIVPAYQGKRGHPILIDKKHKPIIDSLSPEEGLRALLRLCAEDVEEVRVDMPEILRDIDNRNDYFYETTLK